MLYLFWKLLACWPQIHVKMGDPAYGGHAIGKRTLNLIIQWLRRSPIGTVNGRTLVRYWNTSVAQWRLAWRPRRGRIRRVLHKPMNNWWWLETIQQIIQLSSCTYANKIKNVRGWKTYIFLPSVSYQHTFFSFTKFCFISKFDQGKKF